MITDTVYAVIRKNVESGNEWVPTDTISFLRDESIRKAKETDDRIVRFSKFNPVVRIAQFTLTEIEA